MNRREVLVVVLAVAFFGAAFVFGRGSRETTEDVDRNKEVITQIQESRVISCRHTYEGIRQVFLPFFPPKGQRTRAQVQNLDKLNRTVNRLKARCDEQTATEEMP